MKQIIIIFFILLGIVSCEAKGGNAQQEGTYTPVTTEDTSSVQNDTLSAVEVSLSQLQGTKWKQTSPKYGYKETTWEFTNNQLKTVSHYVSSNEKIENVFPYYISDSFPSVFIHNCVGKNYTGKYLVTYLERWNRMDWYTITSIDWNTGDMYLFRQPAEDEVGGRPVTIHFKLISKASHGGGRR